MIVGTNSHSQPDPEVLNFFSKNQKVKVIQLPELTIGHVDEVFNIVPAKNQCGFVLLRASPLEMKKFLSSRPPSESLGNPSDEFDSLRETNNPIHKQYVIELQKAQQIIAQKGTLTFEEKSELDSFRLKWLKNTRKEQSAQDVLLNQNLMNAWDERQITIENATSEIIAEIKKTTGKDCQDEVVDIPVFWTATGTPVIANPVNGLTVNGNYFYSKGRIRKSQPLQYNTNGISDLEISEDYTAYNNYVQQKLKPIFADKLNAIDLKQYDEGNGNFHCATTSIFLPCK